MLAFRTLKAGGGAAPIKARMPVNVKKFPSTMLKFDGTIKSEMISGSPANAIWTMGSEDSRRKKNFRDAMAKCFDICRR